MAIGSQFLNDAKNLDSRDGLGRFKGEFTEELDRIIYLDGNSLGPLPKKTAALLQEAVQVEWGSGLIRSWNKGWYDLPIRLGEKLAPLLGAHAGEVCFADSVTVNLFKLTSSVLKMNPERTEIVTDVLNFPSDMYTLQGLSGMPGNNVRILSVSSKDGMTIPVGDYAERIGKDTALVTLSHVVFKSGYLQDLEQICNIAHEAGALVLADLSHSVGAVPINLEKWGVDLAVGCSYKFINGGPGAPAFLYVRKNLQDKLPVSLAGWFGAKDPFSFRTEYAAADGINRFQVGTPPILSMRAIEPGLDLLAEAGMPALREKSVQMSEFFLGMWKAYLEPLGFELGSPRDPELRGSHVSLKHPEAYRINRAMIDPIEGVKPVIPDFRKPDNLRLGFCPLYLSFEDLVKTVERIVEIVETREFERFGDEVETVT